MSSSTDTNNPQRLTEKKKAENELTEMFQRFTLTTGPVQAPERKAAGTSGQQIALDTNIYQVQTTSRCVYRYDVTVTGKSKRNKDVDLTKRSESSYVIADRINVCRDSFLEVFRTHADFFGADPSAVYYDLQSILYTLKPLDIPSGGPGVELAVTGEALPGNLVEITMGIKNVREDAQRVRLDDLASLVNMETLERDRSLLNFIELAVNQVPMFRRDEFLTLKGSMAYFMNGADHGLPERELDRGGTKYLASGVQKSATLIEGFKKPDADPNQRRIGILLEAKHSPFHSTKELMDCIQNHDGTGSMFANFSRGEMSDQQLNIMTRIFKKLAVLVRYPDGRTRRIEIGSFDQSTSFTNFIDIEGQGRISVADYFYEKYQQRLQFPNAHLVKVKEGTRHNFYPPELLQIADNQVVTADQMDAASKAQMIRACAVRPDHMRRDNALAARAIHLHDSEYTQAADIRFSQDTLGTKGRVLPAPSIRYGKGSSNVESREASWRIGQFLVPGSCENYSIYVINNERTRNIMSENDLKAFQLEVDRYAARSGMRIGRCVDTGIYTDEEVEICIKYCHDNRIKLCLFITPENIKTCHSIMKSCEHKYNVITQDIQVKTAKKILQRGAATLENYLSKTNIKLGGLNHAIEVRDNAVMAELKETMFVGIATNQPGSKTTVDRIRSLKDDKPGVLGYAANFGKDYNEFVGDFFYTVAYRPEFFGDLRDMFKLCVERFTANRGKAPARIVFYYTGLTEGQFENIYKFAVPLIKDGIRQANNDEDIPLTLLAVQKMNNVRLFPKKFPSAGKDHEFNVPHGTVVDSTIVHPVFPEFYLVAHSALKGTARVPRYTIVLDENNYSLDILEGVTHALSYEHQIVGRATSLVTPVYVAEDYARRGRDVFNAESRNNSRELPRVDNGWDLSELTKMLNYSRSDLADKRVNA